jgi:hypothetical protein
MDNKMLIILLQIRYHRQKNKNRAGAHRASEEVCAAAATRYEGSAGVQTSVQGGGVRMSPGGMSKRGGRYDRVWGGV